MTNDEFQMTKEFPRPNNLISAKLAELWGLGFGPSSAVTMQSEIRPALTLTLSPRRDFPERRSCLAPLNRSGGHPACRRGPASCRPEQPSRWVERSEFWQAISAGLEAPALRQAECPPLQGSWRASTSNHRTRIGTMNRPQHPIDSKRSWIKGKQSLDALNPWVLFPGSWKEIEGEVSLSRLWLAGFSSNAARPTILKAEADFAHRRLKIARNDPDGKPLLPHRRGLKKQFPISCLGAAFHSGPWC